MDAAGLQLSLAQGTLAGFLLAVARTAGFVLVAPPFNTRSVPARARVGASIALAIPVTAFTTDVAPDLTSSAMLLQMLLQAVLGLLLGYLVMVAVATIQAVGELLDAVGGFQMSMALDPLLLVQTSVMGRLHQMLTVTLLFVTDGHLMIIHGLTQGIRVAPTPSFDWAAIGRQVQADAAGVLAGAVEIAAPVMAAIFVTDIALGLLTRAAPALNAFSLGFPLKILLTLTLVGLVVMRIPSALEALVEHAVLGDLSLTGARGR
jgi:flagellar biosynthetic protein FliR